jgi:hypothetical protein
MMGIEALTRENSATEDPRNTNVADPAATPKMDNCFVVYPFSMAVEANRPVQKTIVRGLERVSKKVARKLEI